jgi:DNA-binding GntR family transcriptional regulator
MRQQANLKLPIAPSRRGRKPVKAKHRPVQSLRDTAYEAIKHRIITLAFKPGEYVNELQLSEMLGIGRTPVHQAIDRLMLEGQVEIIPRKGIIVKPLSLSEILEITEIRLLNEGYCLRRVVDRASDADIAALGEILKEARAFAKKRDVEQMMLLDREFHLQLARLQGNVVLEDLLRNLIERSLRFWFISLNAPQHFESVQDEHDSILAALKKRDASGAERAMRKHIESFRTTLIQYLQHG